MAKQNFSTIFFSALIGSTTTFVLLVSIFFGFEYFDKTENSEDLRPEVISDSVSKKESVLVPDYRLQEDLIVDIVEKASPAVVSIIITKDVPVLEQYFEERMSPFDDFFFGGPSFNFQMPKYRDTGRTEEKKLGGGSGFIVSKDGYLITNRHVVDTVDADYTVFLHDGTKFNAEIIAKDELNDIAVLKIDANDLSYLEFADSGSLKVGQTAIAIGNPLLEFNNSVSVGIVSGLSRQINAQSGLFGKSEFFDDVIQTDAAINPGNSGGPLLNLDGKVIGVNVAVANADNIGFSLPSNLVSSVFESVKKDGKILRPYLGIRYVPITPSLKEKNNLSVDFGVLVLRGENMEDLAIIPGSPADKAGILENDIILEIDSAKLDEKASLARIIAGKKVGESVDLKVLSKGKEKTIIVELEELKK
jgi:serine protease Do